MPHRSSSFSRASTGFRLRAGLTNPWFEIIADTDSWVAPRAGAPGVFDYRLADALPIMVMIADGNGSVRFFNRRWHEFTGHDLAGPGRLDDWLPYLHPDDAPVVHEQWHDAVRRQDRTVRMRYRLRDKRTGRYRWFSASAVGIEDESGQVVQWVGTAIDIDDEVKAREDLNEALTKHAAVAAVFQAALLPDRSAMIPGVTFDAEYRPSTKTALVGGDWYDSVVFDDGRAVFSIGDVMGHGIDAAIGMGRVRQSIFTVAANIADPSDVLHRVNRVLMLQNTIATAIVGTIDAARGSVQIASAGHPRPIVRGADGACRELVTVGTPLGVVGDLPCETTTLRIVPGDTLVLYTDGLTEFDRDIETAEAALLEAIRLDRGPIAGFAGRLCDAVLGSASAADDIAVLVIGFD